MSEPGKDDIIGPMSERSKPYSPEVLLTEILSRVPSQIEKYRALLEEDKDGIHRLGEMSLSDLKRNIKSLETLNDLLQLWSGSPRLFTPTVRDLRETEDGVVLALKLRKSEDSSDLPLSEDKAQQQISLYLDFRHKGKASRSEIIQTISFKGLSPQEVLERCKRFLPRDARVIINSAGIWRHPRTERVKIDPGAGIEFRYTAGSKVISRGVGYVGVSPHFSEDLSTGVILPEEMVFLREQISNLYPQRSR